MSKKNRKNRDLNDWVIGAKIKAYTKYSPQGVVVTVNNTMSYIAKLFLSIACLIFVLAVPTGRAGESHMIDRVVAVVNNEAITQSELDMLLRPVYEAYKQEYSGEELIELLTEAREKLLNQLIEDRLVFQEATERGLEIQPAMINERIEAMKHQFQTEDEFYAAMEERGMSMKELREQLRRQALVRGIHDMEIRSKIVVSPTEIEQYYLDHKVDFATETRIKVRSITIKKNFQARNKGVTDELALGKINEIKEKLASGATFEQMAQEYSEDTRAEKGGLTEWINRGEMIPAIDEAIFKAKPGEVTDMIETPMGYHLFMVSEIEEGYSRTLEDVRNEIHEILYRQKLEERFNKFMEDLKRKAYISIR